ncbi:hypothetical protein, conserved [Angomonas deanei]|uniref:Uncharacterized protein n=1 Tax=Angomonas deanei TaxID=59799 RepID=A0A7G2C180_9TRYP|nr:hypothetical protein, conserved [Angomonas deanei]
MVKLCRAEFNRCADEMSRRTAWRKVTCGDLFQRDREWLEGVHHVPPSTFTDKGGTSVTVKYYIFYSDLRQVAELCFSTSSQLDEQEMARMFPKLDFSTGSAISHLQPLVSPQFREEVHSFLWTIHSCDFDVFLGLSDAATGDSMDGVLSTFIRGVNHFVPFPAHLLP